MEPRQHGGVLVVGLACVLHTDTALHPGWLTRVSSLRDVAGYCVRGGCRVCFLLVWGYHDSRRACPAQLCLCCMLLCGQATANLLARTHTTLCYDAAAISSHMWLLAAVCPSAHPCVTGPAPVAGFDQIQCSSYVCWCSATQCPLPLPPYVLLMEPAVLSPGWDLCTASGAIKAPSSVGFCVPAPSGSISDPQSAALNRRPLNQRPRTPPD